MVLSVRPFPLTMLKLEIAVIAAAALSAAIAIASPGNGALWALLAVLAGGLVIWLVRKIHAVRSVECKLDGSCGCRERR